MKPSIYLDHAASTPISEEVLEAMQASLRELYGNPSSIHAEGRRARAKIEEARKTVAHWLGASIGEIFFTSGGTEANNMVLKCAVRDLGVQRIISSPIEHHCVLHSVQRLAKEGIDTPMLNVDARGHIDYEQLEVLLQSSQAPTLVSLMHANNEIGTLLDLERVAALCQQYGAWLHSDTVQTVGHYPINVAELPVHFISGSAHKFHGPKGVGFVYISGEAMLQPFIDGGSQERNMRAGTENLHSIVGMAKALQLACEQMDERRAHIEGLRQYFWEQLRTAIPDIGRNGDPEQGLYTVLSVSFPPSPKAGLLLMSLDIAGICASGGSACSSGADAGSHVIQGIQGDPDRTSIRFSFSHYNTRQEIDFVVDKLASILGYQPASSARV
jgi:cysteine desulfurase